MSGLKMQMRLFTNQTSQQNQNQNNNQQEVNKKIVTSLSLARGNNLRMGNSNLQRNFTALQLQGQRFCRSCSDKKK
tara:strand:+ start:368 stop:595 length:228 start_codon:yes stop_codon:yes gene_type:complete